MKKKKPQYFSTFTFAKNEEGKNPNYKESKKGLVTPKKQLGQHFLTSLPIAQQIVESLTQDKEAYTLEVGAGTGVLTELLLQKVDNEKFFVVEIDLESVNYLQKKYPNLQFSQKDILETTPKEWFLDKLPDENTKFRLISNFPYNISSQIFFKVLDYKHQVTEVVGMLQEEVARRFCAKPKTKDYGILSVFLQAYYDLEYLFQVPPEVFNPPPKVYSGVIRLKRNEVEKLDCDEKKFRALVKLGFNQRRKTLRNSLKTLNISDEDLQNPLFELRAEALSVADWVFLTNLLEK
jgi:16S rRNA (adenine1518-N6/adenine1519-N6)-dimethyltransferase